MFNGRSFWTCILFPGLRLLRWRTPVEGMNAKQDYLQSAPTELTAIWQQHSQTEHANHSFAQCICGEQRGQRKRFKKLYHEVIHLLHIPNKKQEKIIFRQFLNYFGFDYDLYILFDHWLLLYLTGAFLFAFVLLQKHLQECKECPTLCSHVMQNTTKSTTQCGFQEPQELRSFTGYKPVNTRQVSIPCML